jgi:L-lactate dehydrogenase (cytochrome)
MTDRQLPKWSELKPLLRPKPITAEPDRPPAGEGAHDRGSARDRQAPTPRSVFDYTDGAAEAEISLSRARRLFAEMELQPSILRTSPRSTWARRSWAGARSCRSRSRRPDSPG